MVLYKDKNRVKIACLFFYVCCGVVFKALGLGHYELLMLSLGTLFIHCYYVVGQRIFLPTSSFFLFSLLFLIQILTVVIPLLFCQFPFYRFFDDVAEAEFYYTKYFFMLVFALPLLFEAYKMGRRTKFKRHDQILKMNLAAMLFPFMMAILAFCVICYQVDMFYLLNNLYDRARVLNASYSMIAVMNGGYISSSLLLIANKKKFACTVFLIISFLFVMIGERGAILFFGIFPILIVYLLKCKSINLRFVFNLLACFALLFCIIGSLRNNSSVSFFDSMIDSVAKRPMVTASAAAIKLVDEVDFYYGKNLHYFIYALVPRALWNDKPVVAESAIIGMDLKKTSNYIGSGLPTGLFAYGYVQVGYLGVFLMTLFTGVFSGVIEKFLTCSYNNYKFILYAHTAPFYIGLFSTEAQVKAFVLLVILFGSYWLNRVINENKNYNGSDFKRIKSSFKVEGNCRV